MKNRTVKDKFHNTTSPKPEVIMKVSEDKPLTSKADKTDMTEQLIAPPARVWEKIERVLDQQEVRRKEAAIMIQNSFGKKKENKKSVFIATLAGVSVLAGVIWFIL